MRRSRTATARLRQRVTRGPTLLEGCAWRPPPTWSSFPASQVVPSFRSSLGGRNRRLALGVCAPLVPSGRAAIPRVVRVRRCRHPPARGGRHSPGSRERWPPSPAPRRWPPSTRREAHSVRPPRTSRIRDVEDLNRRRRRSRCLCRRTRGQELSARRRDLGLVRDGRCGLRPGAHRRAGGERAEPGAARPRRLTGSCSCLMQCFADELDLFTGVA